MTSMATMRRCFAKMSGSSSSRPRRRWSAIMRPNEPCDTCRRTRSAPWPNPQPCKYVGRHSAGTITPHECVGRHSAEAITPHECVGRHSAGATTPHEYAGRHSAGTITPHEYAGRHSAGAITPHEYVGRHSAEIPEERKLRVYHMIYQRINPLFDEERI